MDSPGSAADTNREQGPVFVSFSTSDGKQAQAACKAIERRGMRCWIASRDVAPGENYQEAIVAAISKARAMVLLFSAHANDSEEIKKELSLASRYRIPVMVLRMAPAEPSGAFAYELATRQWIDAFRGWERSIDTLVGRIGEIADQTVGVEGKAVPATSARRVGGKRAQLAAAGLLLLLLAAGIWWLLQPAAHPRPSMAVRLTGFKSLSGGLPPAVGDTVDAEMTAAFNADGIVGISTAPAPPPGSGPAYSLGGTMRRDGNLVRVITTLTNERSGATLWSATLDYPAAEVANIPRHIAVDAGNVVRCGLFGASTYPRQLPDGVLKDYLLFCQGHWDPNIEDGRKALVPAQRVVAAVPDFSWGWAAVAGGYWKVALETDEVRLAEQARASGREAADRAIAIDPKNSEALWIKSMIVDRHDWVLRESLLKRAIAARRLDCGCEHHQYGWLLLNVGRASEATEQLRQANDMLALYVYTSLDLAYALVAGDKLDEAMGAFVNAASLAPDGDFARWIAKRAAMETGNTEALGDPALQLSPQSRAAFVNGWGAAASGDPGLKAQAVRSLLALPREEQVVGVALLLGRLGADHQAFEIAARLAKQEYPGPTVFWYQTMRGALRDPAFPALANELGLFRYWKATGTRPDACNQRGPPDFCRMF